MIEQIRYAIEKIQESEVAQEIGKWAVQSFVDWVRNHQDQIWATIQAIGANVYDYLLSLLSNFF